MADKIVFDKEMTTIIKGFAIVFMIILHVFGGSGWYDVDLKMNHNEVLMNFMPTFKICVGMFVFMVGYVAYGLMAVVHKYVWATSHNDWTQALFDCLLETPLMLLGYTFAKIKIYEKIKVPTKWTIAFIAVLVAVIVLVAKAYISGSLAIFAELIYAPIMIFCILVIFTAKPLKITSKVMMELGDKSVYMWFFHALFFTAATRPTYQHLVLISDNLWVIALWTIILSYGCSALIKKIVEI